MRLLSPFGGQLGLSMLQMNGLNLAVFRIRARIPAGLIRGSAWPTTRYGNAGSGIDLPFERSFCSFPITNQGETNMRYRMSILAIVLFLAPMGVANAQVSSSGTIEVVVEDADGGRLPGVTVTASAADTDHQADGCHRRRGRRDARRARTIRALHRNESAVGIPGSDAHGDPGPLGPDSIAAHSRWPLARHH